MIRRDVRFGDSNFSIVITREAANIRPDDSRTLGECFDNTDLLRLLNEEISQSKLFESAWNEAINVLIESGKIQSSMDFHSWYDKLNNILMKIKCFISISA